jgi:curli biogenesis system outer membrane secretion channel CsgG
MKNISKSSKNNWMTNYACLPILASFLTFSFGSCSTSLVNAAEIKSTRIAQVSSSSKPAQKVRVAVLDFDFSSVSNQSFLSIVEGGSRGVSDQLVNRLVKDGQYSVIERSKLDAILREQNLGASGRVDASTAAQIGRILGVDAVIIGSVTQFDVQRRESGGGFFGIGARVTDTDAYVKLNIRVVSTTTAEILSVAEGNGNASQSDSRVSIGGIGGGSATSNEGRLLTKATEKALDQIVTDLNANASKLAALPRALPTENAVVADASGGRVILNKGTSNGYRSGMKLSIERVTRVVKDPTTQKVIRRVTQQVGIVEITSADSTSSEAKIISGGRFKIGDLAVPVQ